ncbi:MAG: aldo/keto reductase [Solirubrobacterales bacterium]
MTESRSSRSTRSPPGSSRASTGPGPPSTECTPTTPVERPRNATAYLDERGLSTLVALDGIAADHGTTVAAISLAWPLSQPTVTAPIAGARAVAQLEGLLPVIELVLSDAEIERLAYASHEENLALTLGVEL